MAGPEEAVHRGCDNHPPFVGGKSVLLFGQVTGCCTPCRRSLSEECWAEMLPSSCVDAGHWSPWICELRSKRLVSSGASEAASERSSEGTSCLPDD